MDKETTNVSISLPTTEEEENRVIMTSAIQIVTVLLNKFVRKLSKGKGTK